METIIYVIIAVACFLGMAFFIKMFLDACQDMISHH